MKNRLERLVLRICRWLVDRADELVHGWEVCIRDRVAAPRALAAAQIEVDPIASAAREKQSHKARPSQTLRASRPRQSRLRYVGGQFVREETSR